MLVRARAKRYLKEVGEKVVFIEASAEELPLASESIDTVMVAYGVRNFSDRQKALREVYRVLRPGGRLFVLEFSTPHGFMFKGLYRFYFRRWVPIVGGVVSKSRSAYEYLPRSVYAFPEGEAFLQELKEAGFASEFERRMTGGVVTLYASAKPLKPMQC
jgi:ubiquinone/menaquinone biosynthesis methyltransferase ubiE